MNKTIWMCWFQGEYDESMSELNKECIKRWKELNPTWEVNVLSSEIIGDYVPEYFEIVEKSKFDRNYQAKGDLLRLLLLNKYGGVWVDVSVYPMLSLDCFISDILNDVGFFAYRHPRRLFQISSWFLVVDSPNHYLIRTWLSKFTESFINSNRTWNTGKVGDKIINEKKYYQVHRDLARLYASDGEIKYIIDNMVQICTRIPHSAFIDWKRRKESYVYKRPNLNMNLENEKIKIASYSVSTENLGDHIQIIAQLRLLKELGIKPEIYINRDIGVQLEQSSHKMFLVMNGWHKNRPAIWPPSDNIIPFFIGFHARTCVFPNVKSKKSIEYLKKHEPIGCRDLYTYDLLKKEGVESYVSNCLTTTFPLREIKETQTKIFVSSRNKDILKILPPKIRANYEFVNHYTSSSSSDFNKGMESAQNLLDNYRDNAKLVITTFLHCALPCIAMGIPVIVFYPHHHRNWLHRHQSDLERMSTLKEMIKCHKFDEVSEVDWNPTAIETEDQKIKLIKHFSAKVKKYLKYYDGDPSNLPAKIRKGH